jgi:hypothetical protein
MRPIEQKKLLTLIASEELVRTIVDTLRAHGVGGYTIVPATGAGTTGIRSGALTDSTMLIYVILSEARLMRVLEDIDAMMLRGHRVKALFQDISILPRKGSATAAPE